ncbi:MAG: hypothetical protein CBC38_05280 [Gammaproteobacteria bacterium TMED78]|nr:MAG: hypothetical protein CBC38_05280 [Gammaproteobacteria bacterium TMED78]
MILRSYRILFPIFLFFSYTEVLSAPDLNGIWQLTRGIPNISERLYSPKNLTEEGNDRLDVFNIFEDDLNPLCIPSGIGRLWDEPDTVWRVDQYEDRVEIHYEMFDIHRIIMLNQDGHPLVFTPSARNLDNHFMPTVGHSIGWYEGDTLVIDTLGASEGIVSTEARGGGSEELSISDTGSVRANKSTWVPQSEAMRSIERIYRDDNFMAVDIVYFDSITMMSPQEVRYRYSPSSFSFSVYGCVPEEVAH